MLYNYIMFKTLYGGGFFMKIFKRLTAAALAAVMTVCGLYSCTAAAAEDISSGGWYNAAYAVWKDDNPEAAVVRYKPVGSSDLSYKTADKELVRKAADGEGRVDIPGLAAGSYDIEIIKSDKTKLNTTAVVFDEDRSGYAHFGRTEPGTPYYYGVGAYKDDGTPKKNAKIVYVTEETKNTVKFDRYTGIGEILTNAKYIKDPLIVRIIGEIDTTAWELTGYDGKRYFISETTGLEAGTYKDLAGKEHDYPDTVNSGVAIDGLSNRFTVHDPNILQIKKLPDSVSDVIFQKTDDPEKEDTAINMMNLRGDGKDNYNLSEITIEGVGPGAALKNWGLSFRYCESIEIKNLSFGSNPEDAVNAQNANYVWVHRCTFNRGANHCDITFEKDKYFGDGSMDMNENRNITASYNKFDHTRKTSLNGGGDSTQQFNYTYHHNYFVGGGSRHPLTRFVNLHMYNNYFKDIDSYCISARASAWVFSEANNYDIESNAFVIHNNADKGYGTIKSYGDIFKDYKYEDKDETGNIHLAESRTETYSPTNTNHPEETRNFDTKSDVFYYNDSTGTTDVKNLLSAEDVPEYTMTYSGTFSDGTVYTEIK